MEKISLTILSLTVFLAVKLSQGQIGPFPTVRYRSPFADYYFQYFCRTTTCGFEDICEKRTICPFAPPCFDAPNCVGIPPGGPQKPGICVSFPTGQPFDFRCNTDLGCPNSEICCHGYWNSECTPAALP